jgi:hypothetical protein
MTDHRLLTYEVATQRPSLQHGRPVVRTFRDSMTTPFPFDGVLKGFAIFVQRAMTEWASIRARADGERGEAQYSFTRTIPLLVELEPLTLAARAHSGLVQQLAITQVVPYRYLTQFDFQAMGESTSVSFVTTETIAPDGGLQYDVTYHFAAPSMPNWLGDVGAEYLNYLEAI